MVPLAQRASCVQDAAGHCLTDVEHIVGHDRDASAAIRLAKRMIVGSFARGLYDGRYHEREFG